MDTAQSTRARAVVYPPDPYRARRESLRLHHQEWYCHRDGRCATGDVARKRLSLLDRAPRTTGRSTQWRLPPSAIRRNGTEGRTGPGRFPTEPGTLLAQILLPSGASEILLGHSGLLVGDTMGHPQDR